MRKRILIGCMAIIMGCMLAGCDDNSSYYDENGINKKFTMEDINGELKYDTQTKIVYYRYVGDM